MQIRTEYHHQSYRNPVLAAHHAAHLVLDAAALVVVAGIVAAVAAADIAVAAAVDVVLGPDDCHLRYHHGYQASALNHPYPR